MNSTTTCGSTPEVRANLPVTRSVALQVATTPVEVSVDELVLITPDPATAVHFSERLADGAPQVVRSLQLQRLVAMAPGVVTQNNGLLHVRGVEDGILYVMDGVPTGDRLDLLHAAAPDADTIETMTVMTAYVPAEFGGRTGAVVLVQPESGVGDRLHASLEAGNGNFKAADIAGMLSGGTPAAGFFLGLAGSRTERFLDPVHPGNYNNRGGRLGGLLRTEWHPSPRDILILSVGASGSDFRVPNDLDQQLAGQRQRQQLRGNNQSLAWERVWAPTSVTNVAYFRQSYASRLLGSKFDVPITAGQDRAHVRQGVIASLTQMLDSHAVKAGINVSHVATREFFTFAITEAELASDRDISAAALSFTRLTPFTFQGRLAKPQFSAYLQDAFRISRNLAVSAGLRYDRSSLVTSSSQLSPRLGVSYALERTGTGFRASYSRLFMPPQIENLLLSASEQARSLSPFAGLEDVLSSERRILESPV